MLSGLQLPNKTDADEILHVLAEKTSLTIPTPVGWPRQFSLLSILLLMTFIAVSLGLTSWLMPNHPWAGLVMFVVYLGTLALMVWLVFGAPRWARVFAVGFVIGAVAEWAVVSLCALDYLLIVAPGTSGFAGWYPLTVPIHRLLTQSLSVDMFTAIPCSSGLGLLASGAVGGLAILVVFFIAARLLRRAGK